MSLLSTFSFPNSDHCRLFVNHCHLCSSKCVLSVELALFEGPSSNKRTPFDLLRSACCQKGLFYESYHSRRLSFGIGFSSQLRRPLCSLYFPLLLACLSLLGVPCRVTPWRRKGLLLGLSRWLSLELKCLGLACLLGLLYFPLLWFGIDYRSLGGGL
jgi:hypothetical protein